MCPLLLRPPVFLSGSSSARSGSGFVTSAKSETERKRVAEVTGLNCRMPISALEHLDRVACFQGYDRLLPGRPPAGVAAQGAPLGAHDHGADVRDRHLEQRLDRRADLRLRRLASSSTSVFVFGFSKASGSTTTSAPSRARALSADFFASCRTFLGMPSR